DLAARAPEINDPAAPSRLMRRGCAIRQSGQVGDNPPQPSVIHHRSWHRPPDRGPPFTVLGTVVRVRPIARRVASLHACPSERELIMAEQMVREAVGVFQNADSLQTAVDELLSRGFDRSTLSLMATGDTIERELGHRYRRVEEMADDPNAPHVAYVGVDSPVTGQGAAAAALAYIGACAAAAGVVASGGALALTIAAAVGAGAGGGAIGALLARYIAGQHARRLQEQLE